MDDIKDYSFQLKMNIRNSSKKYHW